METEKLTSFQALDMLYDNLKKIGEKIHEWNNESGQMFYLGDTQGIIASSYFVNEGQLNVLGEKTGIAVAKGRPTVMSAVGFEEGVLYENIRLAEDESWVFYKENLAGVLTLRKGIVSHKDELFVWSPHTVGRLAMTEEYIVRSQEQKLPIFGEQHFVTHYKTNVVDFLLKIAKSDLLIN